VRFAKITLPFLWLCRKTYLRFPSGFFILLALNVFLEVIKILQKLTNHTQFKTIQAWG